MTLKEATEIMQKDKACVAVVQECFEEGNPCGICKYYTDPDKLEDPEEFDEEEDEEEDDGDE